MAEGRWLAGIGNGRSGAARGEAASKVVRPVGLDRRGCIGYRPAPLDRQVTRLKEPLVAAGDG